MADLCFYLNVLYICCSTFFLFMDRRTNNNASHLRKPLSQKKKPITIYEIGEDIELLGGLAAVREILKHAFMEARMQHAPNLPVVNQVGN